MVEDREIAPSTNRTLLPTLICLALQLAAWALIFAGSFHVRHLDLSEFGDCSDVPEALRRDTYVASQFVPFICAVVLLDLFALAALFWAISDGRPRVFVAVLAITGLASMAMHGLIWFGSLTYPF